MGKFGPREITKGAAGAKAPKYKKKKKKTQIRKTETGEKQKEQRVTHGTIIQKIRTGGQAGTGG